MYEKDYIIRLIRQLVVILAEIARLTRHAKYQEALEIINNTCMKVLGLSSRTVETLSYKELAELLTFDGKPDVGKCFALGTLLKAEGELFDTQDNAADAYHRYLKGLNILLETVKAVESPDTEMLISLIEEMYGKISSYKLPAATLLMMLKYHELAGRYSKAEDMLFLLVDEDGCREEAIDEGIGFYERLLGKSPEELAEGGLPLDEVLEGLRQLKEKSR
jgi:hypothetical protein